MRSSKIFCISQYYDFEKMVSTKVFFLFVAVAITSSQALHADDEVTPNVTKIAFAGTGATLVGTTIIDDFNKGDGKENFDAIIDLCGPVGQELLQKVADDVMNMSAMAKNDAKEVDTMTNNIFSKRAGQCLEDGVTCTASCLKTLILDVDKIVTDISNELGDKLDGAIDSLLELLIKITISLGTTIVDLSGAVIAGNPGTADKITAILANIIKELEADKGVVTGVLDTLMEVLDVVQKYAPGLLTPLNNFVECMDPCHQAAAKCFNA